MCRNYPENLRLSVSVFLCLRLSCIRSVMVSQYREILVALSVTIVAVQGSCTTLFGTWIPTFQEDLVFVFSVDAEEVGNMSV